MLVTKITTNNAMYNVQKLHYSYNDLLMDLKCHYNSLYLHQ